MKLSEYNYIVIIERKDFRSKYKTTFHRRGFMTYKGAEKYLRSCRSSSFFVYGWIS